MTNAVRFVALLAGVVPALVSTPAAVQAQIQDWPTERAPAPLSAREAKFPPYQFRTLANGLQVIAVSHHEQPAVSLRLIVRAGGANDPVEKSGVATLVAALLDQGTVSKSAEQIASAIDSIGGLMSTGAGSDLTYIQSVVMKDSFAVGLDMVSDVARNPKFANEELERQRQQILSGLKVGYEDPDYIAGMVFDRLVYGFHPYGKPDSGTPESIASITRDDLVAFHKSWFGANNAILAIVGDISHDEAFAGAERAFGQWSRTANAAAKPVDPPAPTRRLVVIDRPGSVQTEIRVGNVALSRKNPDFLALDLAINVLGGEGGNRLHRVLRSDRGLTYGASADVNALKDTGNVVADTDTRSETTGEALRLIVDEFSRLQRARVREEELADAQAYLTGSFPLTIETPSGIALQILNAVFYGLDLNDLQTYRERVNAISPDDIQRVARQYLHPDRLSIVLVGDASAITKQLAGVGFDQYERIALSELDLGSADLKRHRAPTVRQIPAAYVIPSSQPPPAPAARAPKQSEGLSAEDLIAQAVKAKGGLDKLRSIKTVKATSTTTLFGSQGNVAEFESTSYIRYPSAFRIDADTPSGQLVQVFNSGDYWIESERGVFTPAEPIADQIRGTVVRDVIGVLLAITDGRVRIKRLADVVDRHSGGRALPVVEVSGPGVEPFSMLIDPDTGLILAERYRTPAGRGAWLPVEEAFSDYRSVDGLQIAFEAVARREGQVVLNRRVRSFEYNVPLDPALFTKPR
jgi:zinc protease